VRDSLLRVGVRRERIVIVPSGVDVRRFAAVARLDRDPWGLRQRGVWVVGTVGELTREKNHAMLLDALARVRRQLTDAHLLLVGDGPKRAGLEQRARLLGLADAVTFTGRLEDVVPAYAAFDAFAFPSDAEGLGTALLDAMSAGIPVVATAAGGVLDIARHGESALVVPPRDAEAFAGALVRLRQQPELAAHLTRTAREVAARYDIDRMVDGTLSAYTRLGSAGDHGVRWRSDPQSDASGHRRNDPAPPRVRPPVAEGPYP